MSDIGSDYGQFLNLQDNGREIIATTSNGLYHSEDEEDEGKALLK